MFYAYELFVKKGPLGKVWMAGTMMKKLTKAAVLTSDVADLCKQIATPPVPLALPAQSTLLRGVCRIENKKAYFLYGDSLEAKTRVLLVKKPQSKVDLAPGKASAKPDAITVSEREQQAIRFEVDVDALDPDALLDALLHPPDEVALTPRPSPKPSPIGRVSVAPSVDESLPAPLEEDFQMEPHPDVEPKPGPPVHREELKPKKRKPKQKTEEEEEIPDLGSDVVIADEGERKKAEKRKKKKRVQLPVDEVTELTDEQMKTNQKDVADILETEADRVKRFAWLRGKAVKEKNPLCAQFWLWEAMPDKLKEFYRKFAKFGYPADYVPPAPPEDEPKLPEEVVPEFPEIELESYAPTEIELMSEGRPSIGGDTSMFAAESDEDKRSVPKTRPPEAASPMPTPGKGEDLIVSPRKPEAQKPTEISKMTEVYREVLRNQFAIAQGKPGAPAVITLDFAESLREAVRAQLREELPRRYDVGVSFHQLLILRQLNIVKVKQTAAYGPMTIERGKNWDERFSSSQFDASQSQSQSQHLLQVQATRPPGADSQETQPPEL